MNQLCHVIFIEDRTRLLSIRVDVSNWYLGEPRSGYFNKVNTVVSRRSLLANSS
jgi:hypothetical protein